MKAPTLADLIAFAVMAERRTIERALKDAGVAVDDREDVAQDVTMLAVLHGQDGRLAWQHRGSLVRWLHVVAYRHGLAHVRRDEVHALMTPAEHAPAVPPCEDRYITIETLALLRAGTTPERWRAASSLARGVPIAEIARRAGLTVPGAYNLIRLAREDFRAALARDAATTPLRRQ